MFSTFRLKKHQDLAAMFFFLFYKIILMSILVM
jgi:hypothetical protein